MDKQLRYGSICSGVAPQTRAWKALGLDCAWFSEIEPFPSAVLKHHFPEIPNLGDFTQIGTEHESIDLLVGGTPCQSFSVAGKRAGLDDPRGNLTLEFLALAKRIKPPFILWENVPGFLSDDDGNTARMFLDLLEELGYVCDMDILDAQFFGVAQRRRRVFVCGQLVSHLLRQRTISSGLTVAQCLTESLHLALVVLSGQSSPAPESLTFDASRCASSLQKRMRLFGLDSEDQAQILLANLDVLPQSSEPGPCGLDSGNGSAGIRTSGDIRSSSSKGQEEYPSIGMSLSECLAELSPILKSCITSTSTSETTELAIYTLARTCLHIAGRITPSISSSPCFWNAALSTLTALKEFTNYARSASSSLFTDPRWIRPWSDFIRQAERTSHTLGSIGVRPYTDSILPIAESLSGNPAPSREKGQRVAGTIKGGSGERGYPDPSDGNGGGLVDVAGIEIGPSGGKFTDTCPTLDARCKDGFIRNQLGAGVAHSLRGEGFDASEEGTGRGIPLWPVEVAPTLNAHFGDKQGLEDQHALGGAGLFVPVEVPAVAFHSRQDPIDLEECRLPIEAKGGQAVAFAENCRSELRYVEGVMPSLATGGGKPGVGYPAIQTGMAVRRLTPRECERLQGFSDDYTLIPWRGKMAPDGPRYKSIGNSWAVPVLNWIAKRILDVSREA
jgi:site-specific DNA-cytosine methylase